VQELTTIERIARGLFASQERSRMSWEALSDKDQTHYLELAKVVHEARN